MNSDQLYDSPLNTDNCLLITVKDTGLGIKKENLNKIFERFFREETNENYAKEGTGIGLAYTKELVELHKGSVWVESEPGKGTTFTLSFPLGKENFNEETIAKDVIPVNLEYTRSMVKTQAESNEEIVFDPEPIKIQNKNKPTILIVEDNTDLRNFIKSELSEHYNIIGAKNGKEGWEKALNREPKLIISDVMMPEMDGMELCEKIKTDENTSHIPVILLTAKGGEENAIQGLKTGADDYITKPFSVNILKIKIQNIFTTREKLRERFSQSIDTSHAEITHSLIDEKFVQKAIKIINENMRNHDFDNDAFIDLMDYSRAIVYKKVKEITGQSLSEFIRSIRLKAAAKLFLDGNNSISEVSYLVGFKHPNSLTGNFTKMFGKSPSQFIKEHTKK